MNSTRAHERGENTQYNNKIITLFLLFLIFSSENGMKNITRIGSFQYLCPNFRLNL